ncbi:MAG: hypothetical protein ACK53W_02715, partial [Gemmatimonadota bacterium]
AAAHLRGPLVRFDPDARVGFAADGSRAMSIRRRMQIVVDIEIFDQVTGRVLWEKKGVTAEGEYAERQEVAGRRQAIDRIVADVIEGAQSQW